ncbi:MAG: diaminopimelate decarboxylase [Thermoleophilia bacterium]
MPASSKVNDSGHLEIAGCDVVELAREYGTPLFIYDEEQIRNRCQAYIQAFSARTEDFDIIYASKAFSSIGLCQLMVEEGMSLDVASGGELYTALQASFPANRIYVHGNANTRNELRRAVETKVAYIILDSLDEALALDKIAAEHEHTQPVLLRITPGIEAHTHDFIQTGKLDSKFGVCLAEGVASEVVAEVLAAGNLDLAGFHSHIGSQIFSLDPFRQAVAVMADFMAECSAKYGFVCRVLDLGGGLGAAYTEEDDPAEVDELAKVLVDAVKHEMNRVGLPVPRLLVEPGRSIVANAGVTAYEIETVKTIPGVRTYVAVNGGMSDNMRTMLYGAKYRALIADRPEAEATTTVAVAGKHCESGDILVREAPLPDPRPGDILVTPATGAYGYSMSNNYNGQTRPAVLFVRDGHARVIIRRENYADLVRLHERLE